MLSCRTSYPGRLPADKHGVDHATLMKHLTLGLTKFDVPVDPELLLDYWRHFTVTASVGKMIFFHLYTVEFNGVLKKEEITVPTLHSASGLSTEDNLAVLKEYGVAKIVRHYLETGDDNLIPAFLKQTTPCDKMSPSND